MPTATWTRLASSPSLQRSSQTLSVIGTNAYIYGGELKPREPVDSVVYRIALNKDPSPAQELPISQIHPGNAPPSRVGSACTTLTGQIYLFSGRGGADMAPLEENGCLWVFDPASEAWDLVCPSSPAKHPVGRSYHAMTSDGVSTIFLHAGCAATGRLRDFWAFDVPTRVWTELPAAPGPGRGGAAIAFCEGRVCRMNGFDGQREMGGAVDVFDTARGAWETVEFPPDGVWGPVPRSVGGLVGVGGRLVTMFGERDPSVLGHQGAGKMLGDVWVFDVEGRKWEEVRAGVEGEGDGPVARGWFDVDVVDGGVVVHGGLSEDNGRLGDLWRLDLVF